jgi:hypothetical protein
MTDSDRISMQVEDLVHTLSTYGVEVKRSVCFELLCDQVEATAEREGVSREAAQTSFSGNPLEAVSESIAQGYSEHTVSMNLLGPRTSPATLSVLGRTVAGLAEAVDMYANQFGTSHPAGERLAYLADALGALGLTLADSDSRQPSQSGDTVLSSPALLIRLARILTRAAEDSHQTKEFGVGPSSADLARAFQRNAQVLRVFAQIAKQ